MTPCEKMIDKTVVDEKIPIFSRKNLTFPSDLIPFDRTRNIMTHVAKNERTI
jgi:hypothetical protein